MTLADTTEPAYNPGAAKYIFDTNVILGAQRKPTTALPSAGVSGSSCRCAIWLSCCSAWM